MSQVNTKLLENLFQNAEIKKSPFFEKSRDSLKKKAEKNPQELSFSQAPHLLEKNVLKENGDQKTFLEHLDASPENKDEPLLEKMEQDKKDVLELHENTSLSTQNILAFENSSQKILQAMEEMPIKEKEKSLLREFFSENLKEVLF